MGKAYYRILLSFILVIVIPITVFGIFAYKRAERIIIREVKDSNHTLLKLFKEKMDGIFDEVDSTFIQNALTIETFDGITLPTDNKDYISQKKLMNINDFVVHLNNYNKIINNAAIYYMYNNIFITANGRFAEKEYFDATVKEYLAQGSSNVQWIAPRRINLVQSGKYMDVITYIRYLPLLGGNKKAAFIANINLNSLHAILNSYRNFDDQEMYILNSDGTIVLASNLNSVGKELNILSQIKKSIDSPVSKDDITQDNKYISYTDSSISGWKYVIITPMASLLKDCEVIKRAIFLMVIFFILVGAGAAVLLSKRLYKPVENLVRLVTNGGRINGRKDDEYSIINNNIVNLLHNNLELKGELLNSLPVIKEKVLLDILKGKSKNKNNVTEEFKKVGVNFFNKYYVVLAAEIDSLDYNSDTDREVLSYTIKNLIEKSVLKDYAGFVAEEENIIYIVLNIAADNYIDMVSNLSDIIRNMVYSSFNTTTSIGVSNLFTDISELGRGYGEAKEALKYIFVYGRDTTIFINQVYSPSTTISEFCYETQKELSKFIKTGNRNDILKSLENITKYCRENHISYSRVKQLFVQLLGNIVMIIYDTGVSERDVFGSRKLYEELNQIQTMYDAVRWFCDICGTAADFIEGKRNSKNKEWVQEVKLYIDLHYSEPGLCLSSLAERLHISESYLSMIFKEVTGINFVEYVNLRRIEKAKELLMETDLSINEIADRIGLSTASFMRIFKKYEEMTPGQFRNRVIQQNQ